MSESLRSDNPTPTTPVMMHTLAQSLVISQAQLCPRKSPYPVASPRTPTATRTSPTTVMTASRVSPNPWSLRKPPAIPISPSPARISVTPTITATTARTITPVGRRRRRHLEAPLLNRTEGPPRPACHQRTCVDTAKPGPGPAIARHAASEPGGPGRSSRTSGATTGRGGARNPYHRKHGTDDRRCRGRAAVRGAH